MKLRLDTVFPLLFFFAISTASAAQGPERLEKVAEGEYWRWEDSHPIKDTAQSWTIWRTADGYEIENKLPPSKLALWIAAIGSGQMPASRELKEEAKNAAMVTDVTIRTDREFHLTSLRSNGKTVKDGKPVVVADCATKESALECKGRLGDARTQQSAAVSVLYSPAEAIQYLPLLRHAKLEPGQALPISLLMLEEVKNKLQFTEVKGSLRNDGRDKLTIGDHVIEGEKFTVSIEGKDASWGITVWASRQGLVFGVEDSRDASGARILLSLFKRYADF